jgi:shikimate kinase
LLADALGWDWIDADAEIEARAGMTIRHIFDAEGEAGFRRRESETLAGLCGRERVVVATGGGIVLRPDNRERLRSGRVVWLTGDPETLWRRIQDDPTTADRRPNLTSAGGRDEVEALLLAREPLYRECAGRVLDTTTRTPEAIVGELREWILSASGE